MAEPPQPTELRRSFAKLDFNALSRRAHQHSQIKDGKQRRGGGGPAVGRGKPTLEIYRPPNVRTDGVQQNGLALNVHAKEFTMKQQENTQGHAHTHTHTHISRASVSLTVNQGVAAPATTVPVPVPVLSQPQPRPALQLQQSRSSGNILHTLGHARAAAGLPLQQSSSSASIIQSPRVHFSDMPVEVNSPSSPPPATAAPAAPRSPIKSCSVTAFHGPAEPIRPPVTAPFAHPSPGIKRSKSLGAADVAMAGVKEAPDLGTFPPDVQNNIRKAMEDPNLLPARTLMELVRHIMERAVSSVAFALPAAKLCITIIEREKKETFLESLLNSCQQWHQERDKVLKGTGVAMPRYSAFMQFLNEMYCELKRRQLQLTTQQQGAPPGLVLLTLLCKCCQDCLKSPQTQGQTDSLFFVLTSVGRDMEQEMPSKLYTLIANVRDTFLSSPSKPQIKKTLLQLIELHAARWQLPAAAVMYYTTQQ